MPLPAKANSLTVQTFMANKSLSDSDSDSDKVFSEQKTFMVWRDSPSSSTVAAVIIKVSVLAYS